MVRQLDSVDQILRDHGLTRENAKQYVGRCAAYNKLDISKDTGLSEDTVHRYKREFQAMKTETRIRVMAVLLTELYDKIVDDGTSSSQVSEQRQRIVEILSYHAKNNCSGEEQQAVRDLAEQVKRGEVTFAHDEEEGENSG